MVHGIERTQARSEEGIAVAKPGLKLESAAAGIRLVRGKAPPALEQGHLGRQVAAFPHLHRSVGGREAHVITAAIAAGTHQPQGAETRGCMGEGARH